MGIDARIAQLDGHKKHVYTSVFVWRHIILVWEREPSDRGATIGAMTAIMKAKRDKIALDKLTDINPGRLTAVFSSTYKTVCRCTNHFSETTP